MNFKSRTLITLLVVAGLVFLLNLSTGVPCAYSSEGAGGYKDDEKIDGFGGKRSKAEIDQLIQANLAQEEAPDGHAGEGLDQKEVKGKYAVQKNFAYSVHAAQKLLRKVDSKKRQGLDFSAEITELLAQREIIKAADDALQSKFQEVEQRCRSKGFSDVILQRHRKMVDNHKKNIRIFFHNFNELERLVAQEAWDKLPGLIIRIEDHLEEYQVIRDPPLLSSGLPHALKIIEAPSIERGERAIPSVTPTQPEAEKEEPLEIKEEKREVVPEEKEGPYLPMSVTGPPGPEDLAPTIDVQLTQEIVDLAASLDNSPLKIYKYVRDNFDFEPYLGSRKGSQETLNQKSGNDYDLASLLIALLRASDNPARYVRGTVELPVDRAMNWLGVEDGATAGSILTTVGSDYSLSDRRYQRRSTGMAEVKVFYDQEGNTLTVWFADPQAEYVCEETGDEVILMKDKSGSVIGFERLNFSVADSEQWRVAFETVAA